MENLERQFSQVDSVIESLRVALELCANSTLMMEGVVTTALNRATALQAMMLAASGCSGRSPLGPEADEEGEDDDSSWMDDMEATGVAPV